MELMLRCEVPDNPGALSALAGAVSEAGGDIHAVDVVESANGRVLDDLLVVVDAGGGAELLAAVEAVPGCVLVHAGPSRGHPADAVTRLAMGLEALATGQSPFSDGVAALVGGMLRASDAELRAPADAPPPDPWTCVVAVDGLALVVTREYRFTASEVQRAEAVARMAALAARGQSRVG